MIRNSPRTKVLDEDLYLEIAKGNIKDHVSVNKFGYSDNINSSYSCVCDNGGVYAWDTTPGIATLVSDNASDVSTIRIYGVLSDFSSFTEDVVLTGTTPVNTTNTDIKHIYRAYTVDDGLLGDITITLDSSVVAKILYDNNRTLMATYVIPKGYTGYILQGNTATGQGKEATVQFRVRTNDTVFQTVHVATIYENNYTYKFPIPLKLPEKTVLEVRAKTTSGTINVSATFDLILIEN